MGCEHPLSVFICTTNASAGTIFADLGGTAVSSFSIFAGSRMSQFMSSGADKAVIYHIVGEIPRLELMEHRLADMAVLIKNVTTYKQLRPVSMEYRKAKDKAQFRREHESTLILYEAAAKALKEQGVKKLPDLYALKAEYKRLAEEKERLYEQYGEAKKRMQEYGIIKQNVDGILRVKPGKEWTQEL